MTDAASEMRGLYRKAWQDLRRLRESCEELLPQGTPVLAFGRWMQASGITAGLNPSQFEFLDAKNQPLPEKGQRFLHWPDDGELTDDRLEKAFHRSEGYFVLGKYYGGWFDDYGPFLTQLGCTFASGDACHTDYVSPFATTRGISGCKKAETLVAEGGFRFWLQMIELCPRVKLILAHGARARKIKFQRHFGIEWRPIATGFGAAGKITFKPDDLSFAEVLLPKTYRTVLIYWWTPTCESPLCRLTKDRKRQLGELIKRHSGLR
jgi:hypothetical protein